MPTIVKNEPPLLVEIDINGQDRVTAVRVDNQTDQNYWIEVMQSEAVLGPVGRKYGQVFLARTRTEIPVPTTVAGRLQSAFDAGRNRYRGLEMHIHEVP